MNVYDKYRRLAQPPAPTRLREAGSSTPTQEDWFWGRINTSGVEEDYFWRRLSDNWAQKDVLPAAYLDIHNQVYEAYNANPLISPSNQGKSQFRLSIEGISQGDFGGTTTSTPPITSPTATPPTTA